MTPRIIIGISGASGFQYGVKALELLQPLAQKRQTFLQ